MNDLFSIKARVQVLLKIAPKLRSDDNLLIKTYWTLFDNAPVLFTNDCTNFESIRRCRQKIQEENRELQPETGVTRKRLEKEEEYKSFAISSFHSSSNSKKHE